MDDRHAAAQRHGLAAHRPRARQHASGRPDPPRADAAARTRCGSSAPTMPASPRRWSSSATSRARACKRAEIGREAFLDHVWEWKATVGRRDHPPASPPRRVDATGRTSASPWTRASRKPSPTSSSSSTSAASLYRDKRLVNWDPKFQTAISDLEVETRDVQGKFWTSSYPLADDSGAIQVATTRPETMLADMAVAVHPERRALQGADRQADQAPDHRPPDPDRRRRACRSRARQRRGQDHAGPRLQRL